jgi:hypothetical protein
VGPDGAGAGGDGLGLGLSTSEAPDARLSRMPVITSDGDGSHTP